MIIQLPLCSERTERTLIVRGGGEKFGDVSEFLLASNSVHRVRGAESTLATLERGDLSKEREEKKGEKMTRRTRVNVLTDGRNGSIFVRAKDKARDGTKERGANEDPY